MGTPLQVALRAHIKALHDGTDSFIEQRMNREAALRRVEDQHRVVEDEFDLSISDLAKVKIELEDHRGLLLRVREMETRCWEAAADHLEQTAAEIIEQASSVGLLTRIRGASLQRQLNSIAAGLKADADRLRDQKVPSR